MAGLSSLGAPGSPGAGNHDSGGNLSPRSGVREQDRFLPIANISRIMKKALPGNAKIAKDAKEMVQECVSEFISFVANEASDKCRREKRKTINGDDLLWAMAFLGFEDYIEPLKLYLAVQRVMASRSAHMSKKMLDKNEAAKLPRPSGQGIRIIEPNEPLPSWAAPALSPTAPAPSSRQTAPVGPNPRMQKRPRINSSVVASSSTGPNFVAPGPGSYDTSEEAGMTEVLNKLESLLQSDFMELNIHKRPPIDLDSIPLNFQPRVYEDSSILLDKTGDVAMELYSHSMLPRDKTMLLKHAHPWIEKEAASLLCQLSLCVHQLSMTCSHYKHECTKIKQRLKDYKSSVAVEVLTIQEDRKRFEAEHAKHQSVIDELKARKLKCIQLEGELNKLRVDNLERKKQLTLARNCLDSEKRRSYELGSQDGVRMYRASPQFQTQLKDVTFDARRTAIRDFLKSKQLYDLMMSNAVNDQLDGFYKAIDYLKKDGLLKPGFNTDEFEAEYKGKDLVRPSLTLDEPEEFTDFPEFRIIMERHFQQTQAS